MREPARGDDLVVFRRGDPVGRLLLLYPAAGGRAADQAACLWMGFENAGFPMEGLALVTFEWPGQAASRASLDDVRPASDAAYAAARARFPDAEVALAGISLGGGPAAERAVREPPVALLLDSPSDLAHEIRRRRFANALPPLFFFTAPFFAAGVPDGLSPEDHLGRLPGGVPVLLLRAEVDPIVDAEEIARMAKFAPGVARIATFPGTAHGLLAVRPLEAGATAAAFLRTAGFAP